ncbi:DUF4012 domain-containing protein [Microbacterium keratanolyticum]|uniref:DUF4012 domain-containing protein n=1 Tax=Microbacterium keratanolyticum TaxID=67574 RepID=UPI00363BA2CF
MTELTPPISRRARRQLEAQMAAPGQTPTGWPLPATPEDARLTPSAGSGKEKRKRRALIWVISSIAIVVVALLVAGGIGAKHIYDRAMDAREHLMAAMPHVAAVKTGLLAADTTASRAAADAFAVEAKEAVAATDDPVWHFAESIPLPVVENLRAVRIVAQIAESLASDVLQPASGVDLRALAPAGGAIDVAALATLSGLVDDVASGVETSTAMIDGIDRAPLIAQVEAGVSDLEAQLGELGALVAPAKQVLGVLPDALGASGPRNYLFMFQGNAEVRASGGSPGSFILLQVDQGRISIQREVASTEFPFDLPETIVPLDAETDALYSDIIARWVSNLSATPDFPTSAAIAQGWWSSMYDDQIDAVVSIDPIALGYFLKATGPLALPTGGELTSENAAPLLLNEAYFLYPTGVESNEFFSAAAMTVFGALTGGAAKPLPLAQAAIASAEEGRLKIWSADQAMAEALADTPLAGVLPVDNADESAVGVFFNDTTGSKMDYYVDAAVAVSTDQCSATAAPNWTTTVTLANNVTPELAEELPRYITGPYYTPGIIATDIIVYTPVGATITGVTVNGSVYPITAQTRHLGRDAVRINVELEPQTSATMQVAMVGAEGTTSADYGAPTVRHTPMVRPTPVSIDAPGCAVPAAEN